MKYLRQFGIILAVTCAGEIMKYFIPLPIPGSIYGLILIAGNKTDYIEKATGRNREQFLHNGFMRLYSQIRQDPEV